MDGIEVTTEKVLGLRWNTEDDTRDQNQFGKNKQQ